MKKKIRKLLKKALRGECEAYRKLGCRFLEGRGCRKDKQLAKLFLAKSMESGSQKGFLMYHSNFSKGKEVIDDRSYEMIFSEYEESRSVTRKTELKRYLRLGTEKQKSVIISKKRCNKNVN